MNFEEKENNAGKEENNSFLNSIQTDKPEALQVIEYLQACFHPNDNIDVITSATFNEKENRYEPEGLGFYTIKAREYVRLLKKSQHKRDFFDEVFSSYNHQAGAWVRINPVTGWMRPNGISLGDFDICRFENTLIQCDKLPLDEQLKKIKELKLPYKALVYSGGKSIHAIVRVDGKSMADYKERVAWLVDYCQEEGFPIQIEDLNPSRVTRLPGCERGNQKQFLIETAKPQSFDEFKERVFIEREAAKIKFTNFAEIMNNLPPLAPEMIQGIVRQGHKMLISGPSKAGKSFALIELAIAVAEGKEWMGHKCKQGKVVYVNLEIDGASFINRIFNVYDALGWEPENTQNLAVINLRGHAKPLDELATALIGTLQKRHSDLLIVDPIYKVLTGDENNASDMGAFCNLFDYIADKCGCTVAYCHHHSKGSQAHKSAMDRASGSGVFARDPDAVVDMTEIGINENERTELKARLSEKVDNEYLKATGLWDQLATATPKELTNRLSKGLAVQKDLEKHPERRAAYIKALEEMEELSKCSGYRINFTLREFKSPDDENVFFQYPIHVNDPSEYLSELFLVGDNSAEKMMENNKLAVKKRSDEKREWYEEQRREGAMVSISDMANEFECAGNTVRKWVDDQEDLKRENGWILEIDEVAPPMRKRGKEQKTITIL